MGIVNNTTAKYVTFLRKNTKFDPTKIETNLKTILGSKPSTAWWGSSITAEYDWESYCDSQYDYMDIKYDFNKPIYWHLSPLNKVFRISFDDVAKIDESNLLLKYIDILNISTDNLFDGNDETKIKILSGEQRMIYFKPSINFQKMVDDGIDALELTDATIGHYFANPVEELFNSWDCESIVVLNKEKIIFEKEV